MMSTRKPTTRLLLSQAIPRELRKRVLDLLEARDRCLHAMTEPNVHELRLAARHLQAVLEVCKRVDQENPAMTEARERLHELLALSGPLRDVQLRTLALGRSLGNAAVRRDLERKGLLELRKRERHAARQLALTDPACFIRIATQNWSATTPQVARGALRQAISHRGRKLRERTSLLEPDDPSGLHRARIALKRYRYLLRVFAPYVAERILARSEPIERLQHRLGKWHDTRIPAEWLQGQIKKNALSPGRSVMNLVEQKMAWCDHEQRLLVAYLKRVSW